MKRKILKIVGGSAVLIALAVGSQIKTNSNQSASLQNVEKIAMAGSEWDLNCFYGCVAGSDGCHCFNDYPEYSDHK